MTNSEPSAGDVFDLERIRQLAELMRENDLSEIELRHAEHQIRITRGGGEVRTFVPQMMTGPASPQTSSANPSGVVAADAESKNIVYIKSPMVGTFYMRPNPNAEPFVRVGEHVDPEKTVCIIEAMKVFNEIPAEVRGKIVAILAEDEEPVDFGKPLFKVDTGG